MCPGQFVKFAYIFQLFLPFSANSYNSTDHISLTGPKQWSWRVVAGQNAAYDQFPCQYQLFFRGKASGTFWYDPVFQVGSHMTLLLPTLMCAIGMHV